MRPTPRTFATLVLALGAISLISACDDGPTGGDRTPPRLIVHSPATSSTGIARATTIVVTYNENIMASSVTPTTVTVTAAGGAAVPGTITVAGQAITFTPTTPLAYNTQYTVTVTGGVRDVSNNLLKTGETWSFTTTPNFAPTLTSSSPAANATGASRTANITATLNEPLAAATVTNTSFTLTPAGGTPIASTVTLVGGNVATLAHTAPLAPSTVYTARLTTAITDVDGMPLAQDITWTFTTVANVPPTVASTVPANNATTASKTAAITATFSEAVLASTVNATTFTVTAAGGAAVAGTITVNGATVTFTPTAALAGNTVYTAKLTTGITDLDNAPLAADFTWTFTTVP